MDLREQIWIKIKRQMSSLFFICVMVCRVSPTTRSLEVKGKWNVLRGPPYTRKMTIARQTYLREIKRQTDRYIDRQTVGFNSQKDRYVLHRLRKR